MNTAVLVVLTVVPTLAQSIYHYLTDERNKYCDKSTIVPTHYAFSVKCKMMYKKKQYYGPRVPKENDIRYNFKATTGTSYYIYTVCTFQ